MWFLHVLISTCFTAHVPLSVWFKDMCWYLFDLQHMCRISMSFTALCASFLRVFYTCARFLCGFCMCWLQYVLQHMCFFLYNLHVCSLLHMCCFLHEHVYVQMCGFLTFFYMCCFLCVIDDVLDFSVFCMSADLYLFYYTFIIIYVLLFYTLSPSSVEVSELLTFPKQPFSRSMNISFLCSVTLKIHWLTTKLTGFILDLYQFSGIFHVGNRHSHDTLTELIMIFDSPTSQL